MHSIPGCLHLNWGIQCVPTARLIVHDLRSHIDMRVGSRVAPVPRILWLNSDAWPFGAIILWTRNQQNRLITCAQKLLVCWCADVLSRAHILRFNFMLLYTRWGPLFAQFISFCLRERVSVSCHFDKSFWIFNFENVRLAMAHGICVVPYRFRRYHLRSPLPTHKMNKRTRIHAIKPNVTRWSR